MCVSLRTMEKYNDDWDTIPNQICELDTRLTEDFTDEDFDDEAGEEALLLYRRDD